jgi:hypothetical protein
MLWIIWNIRNMWIIIFRRIICIAWILKTVWILAVKSFVYLFVSSHRSPFLLRVFNSLFICLLYCLLLFKIYWFFFMFTFLFVLIYILLYLLISCLTLNLLTTTIVAPPSNARKWQMGFNSAFKGLMNLWMYVCMYVLMYLLTFLFPHLFCFNLFISSLIYSCPYLFIY